MTTRADEITAIRTLDKLRAHLTERAKTEVCGACGASLNVANSPAGPALRCGTHGYLSEDGQTRPKHEPTLKTRYRQARSLEGAGMTYIEAMNLSYTLKREIDRAEAEGKRPSALTVQLVAQLEAEMTGQTTSQALAIPTTRQAVTYTPEEVDIIKQQIAVGVSDRELDLFLATAQRRGLDPFARQIYAVARRRKNARGEWENYMVMQTGIDGYRIIAARSGGYAGQARPEFGPMIACGECVGGHHPEWAEVTVFKIVRGVRNPVTAIVYWDERVQTTADGKPNSMWRSQPRGQLAKCAEALALRKGFPEELSDLEFGEARDLDALPNVALVDELTKWTQPELETQETFDPETGEIVDGDYSEVPDATPQVDPEQPEAGDPARERITPEQQQAIRGAAAAHKWTSADLALHVKTTYNGYALKDLNVGEGNLLLDYLDMDGRPKS